MRRAWTRGLSVVLVIAMIAAMTPSAALGNGGTQSTIDSSMLTLNGQPVTWSVYGAQPATFRDTEYSLEYWDGSSVDFELSRVVTGLEPGTYTLQMKAYGGDAPNAGSMLYAETGGQTYAAPVAYTGSAWGSPQPTWAMLTVGDIEVGSGGEAVVGLKIEAGGGHWGHVADMRLIPELPEGSVERIIVAPSSINVRPGDALSLQTQVLPQNAANTSVAFSSSDEAVAVVSSAGVVTAVGEGEATITATAEDGSGAAGQMRLLVSGSWQRYGDAPVYVRPVPQLQNGQRSDFIMGVDVSTIYEIERSGRKFYDLNGVEKPVMDIFRDNGVNWVRLRIWNDPKDANGNWYGAGNTDKARVIAMAQQAKALGLHVLIDFHYSDFWADPAHQNKPKAWQSLPDSELAQAVYDYTYEVVSELAEAGAYPDMVQIGNEINGGMLWPTGNSAQKAKPFIVQGINAVRDVQQEEDGAHIKIMIHRANPEQGVNTFTSFYNTYNDLDYDVIGISYYPYWHGSFSNLSNVMNEMASRFGKEIVVAETAYAYTLESDPKNGIGNIFGPDQQSGYVPGVAGQASAVRDVIAAVAEVENGRGLGVFYWEPAWLPGVDTGWATVAGGAYNGSPLGGPEGSGWSNQAMFNFFGEALPSIEVYSLVRQPDEDFEEPAVTAIEDLELQTSEGVAAPLPSTVPVLYADGAYRSVNVLQWEPAEYDYNTVGSYTATGALAGGAAVTANITVTPRNFVVNPGLESPDMSAWVLENMSRTQEAPYTGSYALHFWNREMISAKQLVTGLADGVYQLSMWSRIGGNPLEGDSYMYAGPEGNRLTTPLENRGWSAWHRNVIAGIEVRGGELEIGAVVEQSFDIGGDFDDWDLIRTGDLPAVPVASVTVSPQQTSVVVGRTVQLTAGVQPADASNHAVNWQTSDSAVATVSDSGVVTGVARGTATITASTADGGYTATAAITVRNRSGSDADGTDGGLSGTDLDDGVDPGEGAEAGGPGQPDGEEPGSDSVVRIVADRPVVDAETGRPAVTVSMDQLDLAAASGSATQGERVTVTIEIPRVDGQQSIDVRLPFAALGANESGRVYKIVTFAGTIEVPGDMIPAGAGGEGAAAEFATLSVALADRGGFAADAAQAVGDRPALSLQLLVDGKPLPWSNSSAPVTVSIPYALTEDDADRPGYMVAVYIDGAGSLNAVPNSRYDSKSQSVVFKTDHFSVYAVAHVYKPFGDLSLYSWAKASVERLAASGAINGSGPAAFSPEAAVTRADFTVMLVRALGLYAEPSGSFADVSGDEYYGSAVATARALNITSGVGGDRFNPRAAITREELFALTARALAAAGLRQPTSANTAALARFGDADDVSGYAAAYVAWLVAEGVVSGKNNALVPQGIASRAEAAVLIDKAAALAAR